MHMPDDSSSGGIPFSTRVKPAVITLAQREAAIISRLTEVARTYGLETLCAKEEKPGVHHGQLSFLPTDGGQEVTLIVKHQRTERRDEAPLQIDTGQLFGILKQAAASPQLPHKPENRQVYTPPKVMGSSITFSSMEALEHAVHAIDPWARGWAAQGRGSAAR